MNFNKAIIVGRVTRNPEVKITQSGQTVSSFGIATNRFWTSADGQKQEKVEFHNIVAWGKLAEICNQYLNKGQLVLIEGRIETRTWEGQDGTKKIELKLLPRICKWVLVFKTPFRQNLPKKVIHKLNFLNLNLLKKRLI